MSRLLYNRAIINKLSELIEKYPDWRFGQFLINCDILTMSENPISFTNTGEPNYLIDDPFYEEPEKVWFRMVNNKFCFNENL